MNPFRKLLGAGTKAGIRGAARNPGPSVEPLEDRTVPAIAGTVFHDYNANGQQDAPASVAALGNAAHSVALATEAGVAGVTATAYDAAGVAIGAAVSDANGNFSIGAALAGQQYRVLFAGLPSATWEGPFGAGSGTPVQFVDGAGTANLGVTGNSGYVAGAPDLVTTLFRFGAANDPANANEAAVISFRYNSGTAPIDAAVANYSVAAPTAIATVGQVGSTWGVAANQATAVVYSSAFFKKHAGFGPGGAGAIYASDVGLAKAGTPNATLLVDLNALFPSTLPGGTDTHVKSANIDDWLRDGDNANWDAVGKEGLGGLAISDDGQWLYTVGLNDRRLYAIPLTGPIDATTVKSYALPLPTDVTGNSLANPYGDLRPFAVTFHDGKLYVGAVNTGESTAPTTDVGQTGISQGRDNYGTRAAMKAYVFKFDPAAGQFVDNAGNATATQAVFSFDLNYVRNGGSNGDGNWLPWQSVYQSRHDNDGFERLNLPQAWLTSLTFDAGGNLVLGLRDRSGDQLGSPTLDSPADNTLRDVAASGDMLKAFAAAGGGWVLEENGRNPLNPSDPAGSQSPQGTSNGPGGAEFFYQDNYADSHSETSEGAVLQLPGFPDVVNTVYNPIGIAGTSPTTWFSSGIKLTNAQRGTTANAYQLFQQSSNRQAGKAYALGGLAYLAPAPIELGNRVWQDTNSNGAQDAGEPGLAGVTVTLCAPNGTLLATAVTDAAGNYLFSNAPGASTASQRYGIAGIKPNTAGYVVKLNNPADYAAGGPLFGRARTAPLQGAQLQTDSNGATVGAIVQSTAIATGVPGANDHSIDFGFLPAGVSATFTLASSAVTKQAFLASTTALLGSPTPNAAVSANARWIEQVYRNLLGRGADAGGLAGYLAALTEGAGRWSVVQDILHSAEYRARSNGALNAWAQIGNSGQALSAVDAAYLALLGRDADAASRNAYAAKALADGNLAAVLAEIASSNEYFGRASAFA